jgi:hypothetical protein
MYEIPLRDLKAFCQPPFTEEGEKYVEYEPRNDYEIIIDGKVLSAIYQDDYRNDKVEVFFTDDNASLPMKWGDIIEVKINILKRKNVTNGHYNKMLIANIIGCSAGEMVDRRNTGKLDETNYSEYRVSKVGRGKAVKKFNDNIEPIIYSRGFRFTFIDYDDRIEIHVKRKRDIAQTDIFM